MYRIVIFSLIITLALRGFGQEPVLQGGEREPLVQGLQLYNEKQYASAQALLDPIWRDDFRHSPAERAEAAFVAAQCAIQLYHADADQRVEAFARDFPLSALKNELFLQYAHQLFSLRRYRQAEEYYQMVNDLPLKEAALAEKQFKWAYAALQNENSRFARDLFLELKDGRSAFAGSARYYYAHLLYIDSNYRQALQNFLPLKNDPDFGPLVPYYLAHIYYALHDYDQLLSIGDSLLAQASDARAGEIAKLLADAAYAREKYSLAVRYLERFRASGERMRTEDHFQMGFAYYQVGRYRDARDAFNKISGGPEPLRQKTYYHLGDCYLRLGDKIEARTAFKAAAELSSDPDIAEDAFYNYAKLAYELADPFRDALATLKLYRETYPNSPHRREINGYLANLYLTTKDYERALASVEAAGLETVERQKIWQRINYFRATEHYLAQAYAQAIEHYQAVRRYRHQVQLIALSVYWQALAHYEKAEYAEARQELANFRQLPGASLLPEFPLSHYHQGYASFKMLDFQSSAQSFRAFLTGASGTDPRRTDATLRLGDAYLLTGGYLIAADFYQKAIDQNTSEPPYALYQQAQCLGLVNKNQEKIGVLRKLIQSHPKSPYAEEAQYELALTYLRNDRFEEALEAFAAYRQRYPNSERKAEIGLKEGLTYFNLENYTASLERLKAVVKAKPGSKAAIEAVPLVERAYRNLGQTEAYLDWVEGLDFIDLETSSLDSTAYSAGFDFYASARYPQAYEAFGAYLRRFPKGLFVESARYYAARSAEEIGDSSRAMHYYRQIIDAGQESYREMALAYLAPQEEKAGNWEIANKDYLAWLELAKDPARRRQAQAGVMRSSFALADFAESRRYALEILDQKAPTNDWEWEALRYAARASMALEDYPRAEAAFHLLAENSRGQDRAEALYQLAWLEHLALRYDSSNARINKLIEELPAYREWKVRALLLMARNLWKLDDLFQANYILDFVQEGEFASRYKEEAKGLQEEIAQAEAQEDARREMNEARDSIPLPAGQNTPDDRTSPKSSER